ncbi:MAG: AAA family ATPase [Phycisphaerae bacterium]
MKLSQLKSIRIQNFKAIRDSGTLKLTPLTVLIGNIGSGKSSIIEGLETLQTFVTSGLDRAMQAWHGIKHVRTRVFDAFAETHMMPRGSAGRGSVTYIIQDAAPAR